MIRPATAEDAGMMAQLSGQLGYRISKRQAVFGKSLSGAGEA